MVHRYGMGPDRCEVDVNQTDRLRTTLVLEGAAARAIDRVARRSGRTHADVLRALVDAWLSVTPDYEGKFVIIDDHTDKFSQPAESIRKIDDVVGPPFRGTTTWDGKRKAACR
jgi:hypothetical protein